MHKFDLTRCYPQELHCRRRFQFPLCHFVQCFRGIDSILWKTPRENPMKIRWTVGAYRQGLKKTHWLNFHHELGIYDCNIIMLDHEPATCPMTRPLLTRPQSQQHAFKHILVPFFLRSVIVSGTQDPKIIEIPISKANFQFYQTRFS